MAEEEDLLSCLLDVAAAELNNLNNIHENNVNTEEKLVRVSNKTKAKVLTDVDIFSSSLRDEDSVSVDNKVYSNGKKDGSSIHTYDSDSSSEEGRRNPQQQKYNESGREIKSVLDHHKTSSLNTCSGAGPSKTSSQRSDWKSKKINQRALTPFGSKPSTSNGPPANVCSETIFGISIINPLISSTVLEDRMTGRKAISIHQISAHLKLLTKDDDWVVAGVICNKGTTKTSSKGNQFMAWTLSDLVGDIKTITLFLFGSAFTQFWKIQPGNVVGVLNPRILDKRDGSKEEAVLSVDNSQKIMLIGQSRDLSMCKSIKKNGDRCTAIVNKSKCEFCIYHVKQEYQKCSRRSELQSNFSGKGLIALRNKVLGKNEVFYAGKSYTAIPAKQSRKLIKKDQNRLLSLSENPPNALVKTTKKVHKAAASFDVVKSRRMKDIETLKKLGVNTQKYSSLDSTQQFKANLSSEVTLDKAKANALKVLTKLNDKKSEESLNTKESTCVNTSQLQKSLDELVQNELVDLDIDYKKLSKKTENNFFQIKSGNSISESTLCSTTKSPSFEKQNCPKEVLPNTVQSSEGKRLETSMSKEFYPSCKSLNMNLEQSSSVSFSSENSMKQSTSTSSPTTENTCSISSISRLHPKLSSNGGSVDLNEPILSKTANRAKLKAMKFVEKNGPLKKIDPNNIRGTGVKRSFDKVDSAENEINAKKEKKENGVTSDRFKKMMLLQSKHMDLVDQRDNEEKEKYFKKLQVKEQMEEKMANTYKIECKAVRCLVCKYTSFSAADKCKEEKHRLKVYDAIKRFFKCGHCGNRVACLDIVPIQPCRNCGSGKWEHTTMMKEKIVSSSVSLSIRGGEQTFINSDVTDTNINLLVPDD